MEGRTYDKSTCAFCFNDVPERFAYNMKDGSYISKNGDKYWYKNKKLHRENGPAVQTIEGKQIYFTNGEYIKTEYKLVAFI